MRSVSEADLLALSRWHHFSEPGSLAPRSVAAASLCDVFLLKIRYLESQRCPFSFILPLEQEQKLQFKDILKRWNVFPVCSCSHIPSSGLWNTQAGGKEKS